jgi:hypothetical protein
MRPELEPSIAPVAFLALSNSSLCRVSGYDGGGVSYDEFDLELVKLDILFLVASINLPKLLPDEFDALDLLVLLELLWLLDDRLWLCGLGIVFGYYIFKMELQIREI